MKIATILSSFAVASVLSAGVASADIHVTDPAFEKEKIAKSESVEHEAKERAVAYVELARVLNGPSPSSIRLYDGQPAVFVTAASWDEIANVLAGLPEFKDRFGSAIPVTDTTLAE